MTHPGDEQREKECPQCGGTSVVLTVAWQDDLCQTCGHNIPTTASEE